MTSDILRVAQTALVTDGWIQCAFYDRDTGAHCLEHALFTAAMDQGIGFPKEAYTLLCDVTGAPFLSVWNDRKERTLPDVLAALSAAIAIADDHEREARANASGAISASVNTSNAADLAATV